MFKLLWLAFSWQSQISSMELFRIMALSIHQYRGLALFFCVSSIKSFSCAERKELIEIQFLEYFLAEFTIMEHIRLTRVNLSI